LATVIFLVAAAVIGLIALSLARSRTAVAAGAGASGEDRVRAYGLVLRDRLDRTPFGADLPRAVWRKLIGLPVGDGLVREFHRDFCGHGLIRTEDGVKLCDVQDGGYLTGPAIASWTSESDFVAFFAMQSDYSCSGWDTTSPVFATEDEWYRNNQRLTRQVLRDFID
jgi:hypothetical protein